MKVISVDGPKTTTVYANGVIKQKMNSANGNTKMRSKCQGFT